MLHHTSTAAFLDELASAAPTPGGGGAAAVMGAMGAALVSMVAHLTVGKKGYEAREPDARALLAESQALRDRLMPMVADDATAFNSLMAAYRMPKSTDDERAERSDAIQAGLRAATLAPLHCARAAALGISHPSVISDVGVAVQASLAALRSAALNVQINVPQLKDLAFAQQTQAEVEALLAECLPLGENVHAGVTAALG
jgi:formiminotetrahydrofolate cyclodeaminase